MSKKNVSELKNPGANEVRSDGSITKRVANAVGAGRRGGSDGVW